MNAKKMVALETKKGFYKNQTIDKFLAMVTQKIGCCGNYKNWLLWKLKERKIGSCGNKKIKNWLLLKPKKQKN